MFRYITSRQHSISSNVKIYKSFLDGYNFIDSNSSIINSKIGIGTYVSSGSKIVFTRIGNFCSIGRNLSIIVGRHPFQPNVSTSPVFYGNQLKRVGLVVKKQIKLQTEEYIYVDQNKNYMVSIGSDVWIGDNVSILGGVKVGHGAVLGAGSMITKDVKPYSIVAGNPAKFIKARFSNEKIEKLLNTEWWNWDLDRILENSSKFSDVDNFLSFTHQRVQT